MNVLSRRPRLPSNRTAERTGEATAGRGAIDLVMRPRGQGDPGPDHRTVGAIVRCSGLNVTLTITRSSIPALPVGLVFRFVSRGGCFPSR